MDCGLKRQDWSGIFLEMGMGNKKKSLGRVQAPRGQALYASSPSDAVQAKPPTRTGQVLSACVVLSEVMRQPGLQGKAGVAGGHGTWNDPGNPPWAAAVGHRGPARSTFSH